MKINFDINLTKVQKEIYEAVEDPHNTFIVTVLNRQAGKTVLAEILLIKYLCTPQTYNVYISPTYQLGNKVFKELRRILEGTGIIKNCNAGTLEITTVFNSTVKFFSMEAYNSIRGQTVKGLCILDECAFYPDPLPDGGNAFGNIILPIIKANIRTNKILAISTPKGKRALLWDFYKRCEIDHISRWKYIFHNIDDDELITEDEKKLLKDSIPDLSWREEFLCEFLTDSVSFFTDYEKNFTNYKFDYSKPTYGGIDPSGSGKDDMVLTLVNSIGQTLQYNLKGSLDHKYQEAADILNSVDNLKATYVEINGLGAPIYNEIKKLVKKKNHFYEWATTNTSKEEIISELSMDIIKRQISFEATNKVLFNQLGDFEFSYTKTGRLQFAATGNRHDDYVMSLAIANKCRNEGEARGNYNISTIR